MTYSIRPITAQDNPAMASIIREVMTAFDAVGPGYSINDREVDEMFEAYNFPHSAYFVLVDEEDKVVGGAGIAPLLGGDEDICELKKMYFLPEARGKGMGKAIALYCLDVAREKGYKRCYLETITRMKVAGLLYEKICFVPLSQRMGDTGHDSCGAYYLLTL